MRFARTDISKMHMWCRFSYPDRLFLSGEGSLVVTSSCWPCLRTTFLSFVCCVGCITSVRYSVPEPTWFRSWNSGPTVSSGEWASQSVLTPPKWNRVPIVSSCNRKMNGEVPFIVSISSQASEKRRFEGGFVLCSIPVLNLECKRGHNEL